MVRIRLPISFELEQDQEIVFKSDFTVEFDTEESYTVTQYPNGYYLKSDVGGNMNRGWVKLFSLDSVKVI